MNTQRGFFPIILGALVLLVLVGGGAYYLGTQNSDRQTAPYPTASQQTNRVTSLTPNPTISTNQEDDNEVTIAGSIVDNDTSCEHDGVCKVAVDNYWIITDLGGDPTPKMMEQRGPKGSVISSDGTIAYNVGDNVTGKQVEVFAKVVNENTLTLYGKKDYYMKFKN